MHRREFLKASVTLPLINNDLREVTNEILLPNDLSRGLARHCSLPLQEGNVAAEIAANISSEIRIHGGKVCEFATDVWFDFKMNYDSWSWFDTGKRWTQLALVERICEAGEFTIVKRGQYFVLQTQKCQVPTFRTSHRRLVVDYNDDDCWLGFGNGKPTLVCGNDLNFARHDFFTLFNAAFEPFTTATFFDGDILNADATRKLASCLRFPGNVHWNAIADWLNEGECLFVAFPDEPMI